ncbi:NAD(P)/FAD-dependent oxidoreductase [Streptomyces sp. SID13666]|uniref:dihydrolipoyl dehydrogenase family protein n=1 Tax=unclassified Streptomyces TaxID=2593676 RepID=UPI0013C00F6F|nr:MULTISPECIES: NAD(P)/FAD-dependent oxidoreductase [unclassified Streptomyces]NEA57424.1 NAD(P)/FAD-dependent oxidoreductase [Streptomyces sp. SID13666]NEA75230.1 NAD(P)/FAD-dependent oxidoreductase [Streptomyces sp. SID13588]
MQRPTTDHERDDAGTTDEYDVVVIGAGPGGEVVADRITTAGLTAVVIEAEAVGGECSYWACIPSKALLRPAAALDAALSVAGAREAVTGHLDAAAVLARRNAFVSDWKDTGQVDWLSGAGVDLVRGWGRLVGERRVEVRDADGGRRIMMARQAVVLAPGSAPVLPPIEGLAEVGAWTNREATAAQTVPERLIVVGGGVVACEMATAWSALGSHVTLLVRGPELLAGWEPFVGQEVADGLRALGVTIRFDVEATRTVRDGATVTVELADGTTVAGDELLVAVGRRPRTDDLGLDTVGLAPGSWIEVDDSCQVPSVGEGWLYAVGDVNRRAPLTHMAKYQARACAAAIARRTAGHSDLPSGWNPWSAPSDRAAVPQAVFTRPEVASVGLTELQARRAGLSVRTVEYRIGDVAGAALHADDYRGRAKLVVDEDCGVIVGCTLTGPDAGELIHTATVAVVGEVPLSRLWHAVPSFPTVNEVWLRLLETYGL